MWEIPHSDISGITTKAPCDVALMGERHMRIEISDFLHNKERHLKNRCLFVVTLPGFEPG